MLPRCAWKGHKPSVHHESDPVLLRTMKAFIATTSVLTSILGVTVLLTVLTNASQSAEAYVPTKVTLQSHRIQDLEHKSSRFSRRQRSGLASQLQRRAEEKSGTNIALLDYFNGTDLQ